LLYKKYFFDILKKFDENRKIIDYIEFTSEMELDNIVNFSEKDQLNITEMMKEKKQY